MNLKDIHYWGIPILALLMWRDPYLEGYTEKQKIILIQNNSTDHLPNKKTLNLA